MRMDRYQWLIQGYVAVYPIIDYQDVNDWVQGNNIIRSDTVPISSPTIVPICIVIALASQQNIKSLITVVMYVS